MLAKQSVRKWTALIGAWVFVSLLLAGHQISSRIARFTLPLAVQLTMADLQWRDRLIETLPPLPADPDLVFLGIDASSLALGSEDPEVVASSPALSLMAGPFPWSREVWALTLDRLLGSGAKLVILDLLLDNPREGDAALRDVLARYPGKVVLAANFAVPASSQHQAEMAIYLPPSNSILPSGEGSAGVATGVVNFSPELGGIIRGPRFRQTAESIAGLADHPSSPARPSLAAAALITLGEANEFLDERSLLIAQPVDDLSIAYAARPLYEIFWPSLWERNYANGNFFRDKVVMIGPSAPQFQDLHPTPRGIISGPQLHLAAMTAARAGALFRPAASQTDLLSLLTLGLFGSLTVGLLRRPFLTISVLSGIGVAWIVVARFALTENHLSVALLGPISALGLTGGFGLVLEFSKLFRERQVMRRALERRVSGEVLKEILNNPGSYLNQLGGVRREVAVLFTDLRGFTRMSEHTAPEEMVTRLNAYFDRMVDQIQNRRGMVDKFIGDAIMAVWGSVPSLPPGEGTRLAVRAALAMQRELDEMNRIAAEVTQPDDPTLPPLVWEMGAGIHCGSAITGNIGSEKKLELTVIGDAVNLASRLESVTKQYGVTLVVSETVAEFLREEEGWCLRPLDRVRVAGRRGAVTLWQPLASPDEAPLAPQGQALANAAGEFEKAFDSYQATKFAEAANLYGDLLVRFPFDKATGELHRRCLKFSKNPPPSEWEGAVSLESK